ncbi:hypothetical protein LTR56_027876, partial [Elasticomyces elasticus]
LLELAEDKLPAALSVNLETRGKRKDAADGKKGEDSVEEGVSAAVNEAGGEQEEIGEEIGGKGKRGATTEKSAKKAENECVEGREEEARPKGGLL